MKIKFWPSGHSRDYSVVAEYMTEEDAIRVMDKLSSEISSHEQFSNGLSLSRSGKTLALLVYEGDAMDPDFSDTFKLGRLTGYRIGEYGSRALMVEVDMPTPTIETSALIMPPNETAMLKHLLDHGAVSRHGEKLIVQYTGSDLWYSEYSKTLSLEDGGESVKLDGNPRWRLVPGSFKRFW